MHMMLFLVKKFLSAHVKKISLGRTYHTVDMSSVNIGTIIPSSIPMSNEVRVFNFSPETERAIDQRVMTILTEQLDKVKHQNVETLTKVIKTKCDELVKTEQADNRSIWDLPLVQFASHPIIISIVKRKGAIKLALFCAMCLSLIQILISVCCPIMIPILGLMGFSICAGILDYLEKSVEGTPQTDALCAVWLQYGDGGNVGQVQKQNEMAGMAHFAKACLSQNNCQVDLALGQINRLLAFEWDVRHTKKTLPIEAIKAVMASVSQ